ncbi:hypothetical protein HYU19_00550 [Candidatus Woesearchaeota archaeon]|nr:hypothetical protein [Candidatus Woesearchaeota archaeon]
MTETLADAVQRHLSDALGLKASFVKEAVARAQPAEQQSSSPSGLPSSSSSLSSISSLVGTASMTAAPTIGQGVSSTLDQDVKYVKSGGPAQDRQDGRYEAKALQTMKEGRQASTYAIGLDEDGGVGYDTLNDAVGEMYSTESGHGGDQYHSAPHSMLGMTYDACCDPNNQYLG